MSLTDIPYFVWKWCTVPIVILICSLAWLIGAFGYKVLTADELEGSACGINFKLHVMQEAMIGFHEIQKKDIAYKTALLATIKTSIKNKQTKQQMQSMAFNTSNVEQLSSLLIEEKKELEKVDHYLKQLQELKTNKACWYDKKNKD